MISPIRSGFRALQNLMQSIAIACTHLFCGFLASVRHFGT
jgi:hypothetical protein